MEPQMQPMPIAPSSSSSPSSTPTPTPNSSVPVQSTPLVQPSSHTGFGPQKKRGHKAIWVIVVIVILILLVAVVGFLFPQIASIFSKDIPPFDDSALVYKKISVPDSENAYFDLQKLEADRKLEVGERNTLDYLIAGTGWSDKVAYDIVDAHKESLEYFRLASLKPKYQDIVFDDPATISLEIIMPNLSSYRNAAKVNALQSLVLLREGKNEAALEQAFITMRVAQKIQESQFSLITYLVTIAMKSIALDSIQKVVAEGRIPTITLRKYIQELNSYNSNHHGYITASKDHYNYHNINMKIVLKEIAAGNKEVVDGFAEGLLLDEKNNIDIIGKIENNFYYKKNKTAKLFADSALERIADADKYCDELIPKYEKKPALPFTPRQAYFTENIVGKVIFAYYGDIAGQSLAIKKCEEDTRVSVVQTILAAYAYTNDTGSYPADLKVLVPAYLSKSPIDYFNGKELHYSPASSIYSVGENLKDDGGDIRATWATSTDYGYFFDR